MKNRPFSHHFLEYATELHETSRQSAADFDFDSTKIEIRLVAPAL